MSAANEFRTESQTDKRTNNGELNSPFHGGSINVGSFGNDKYTFHFLCNDGCSHHLHKLSFYLLSPFSVDGFLSLFAKTVKRTVFFT